VHGSADGSEQRFGVLEFFSKLPRQPSAQLPLVSAAVGALVGQTVLRLEQEAAIRRMAQTDEMTGLANRSHFQQLVRAAFPDKENDPADARSFGLLYIDLDRFKPINDAFGHEAGNVMLKAFASRLADLVPPGGVAGRLGGDEFCVLLQGPDFAKKAKKLAQAVLRAAREPVMFNDCPLVVSASIGVAEYPTDGATVVDLLRNADAAMYRSKHGGRNRVSFSDGRPQQPPAVRESFLAKRMAIDADLQQALQRDEFFLVYQPIVEAASGRTIALEALIRWRRENGEVTLPNQFIQIAEERGMISDIDRWVAERACADLAVLHRSGARGTVVSINMAAPEFARATLPQELLELTRRNGIAPNHLCLELTERMMMKQTDEAIAVMRELRTLGFRISLDDFGTEHSSLSRLKNLPITSLKVDRSFIKGLPDDVHDRAIVRAIMELGKEMELNVVVEGVENRAQLQTLRELGNPLVQGYLTGRPRALADIISALC
jgi:diguanylate cyclase (GGDEF)-like protein